MLTDFKVALISAPILGVITANAKRLKQGFQLFEHLILAFTNNLGQHNVRGMINGIPQPALLGFVTHIRPLLIQLSLVTGQFQSHCQIRCRIQGLKI